MSGLAVTFRSLWAVQNQPVMPMRSMATATFKHLGGEGSAFLGLDGFGMPIASQYVENFIAYPEPLLYEHCTSHKAISISVLISLC